MNFTTVHLILEEGLFAKFLIAALRTHETGQIKQPAIWQGETETLLVWSLVCMGCIPVPLPFGYGCIPRGGTLPSAQHVPTKDVHHSQIW